MDSSNDFAVGYAVGDNANKNCGYGYGNGMFGGDAGFFWIFALLLLPMLNGGGFRGNNRGNAATTEDLCNQASFTDLKNSVGRLSDQQAAIARQTDNAICNLGYETLRNFNSLEQQLASCCCETKQMVLENRYLAERNTAAINSNTTEQIQKVLDAISGNRMADMQNQINQLQLQAALCGVVRYPLQTTYSTDCNPFFGGWNNNCGRCCGNGNI